MAGAGAGNKKGGVDLFGITPISKNTRQYWPGMFSGKVNYNVNDRLNISGGAQFEKDKVTPEIGLKYKFQDGGTTPEFEPTLKLFTDKAKYDKAFQMYSDSLLLNQEMFDGESAAGGAAYDRLTAANKEKPGEDADGLSVSRFPDPRMKPVFKEVYKDVKPVETKEVTPPAPVISEPADPKAIPVYTTKNGLRSLTGYNIDGNFVDKLPKKEEGGNTDPLQMYSDSVFVDKFREGIIPYTTEDYIEYNNAIARLKSGNEGKFPMDTSGAKNPSKKPIPKAIKEKEELKPRMIPVQKRLPNGSLGPIIDYLPAKGKGGNVPSSSKNTYNNWLDKL
jgi:hypothetical protein